MKSYKPYSFSKINTHVSCPRKFKYQYIDKLPRQDTDRTALLKGSAVHSILENYPNPSKNKLAPKYQYIADDFMKSRYAYLLNQPSKREESIGLDENFEPCAYCKDALFRGYIDYYTMAEEWEYDEIEVETMNDIPKGWEIYK